MATDLTAKLTLKAQVEGAQDLGAMAERLRALAEVAGDAGAPLRQVADGMDAIARDQQLIDNLRQAEAAMGGMGQAAAGQDKVMQAARAAMQAAGLAANDLAHAQQQLDLRTAQAGLRLIDVAADYGRMGQAAQRAGAQTRESMGALEGVFKQLGMRGVKQITAEIEQLQAAMRALKGQELVPEDATRASAELQRRIDALRAEMRGAQKDSAGAAEGVRELGARGQAAGNQLADAAHKALAWTSALVGLNQLRQAAKAVVDTGSAFEQLQQRLASILGSTHKAGEAFTMLRELARQTPFDVQGLTDSYAKLAAFGLQPTRAQMLALADTAATLGGGTETLAGVTLALGQAWTKGKLAGEEVLQLAERGVPVWDLLAKSTGKSVQELQKMSEAGQLGRDVLLQLFDALGAKNAGASAQMMQTFAGAIARAQGALQQFLDMIAKSGVLEYLTAQLQTLLEEFDRLKASGELDAWAERLGRGFVDVANAAQGLIEMLRQIAPAIEIAMKLFVAHTVGQYAEKLLGVGRAAREAAAGHGELGKAAGGALGPVQRLATAMKGVAYLELAGQVFKLARALGELKAAKERQAKAQAEGAKLDAAMAERLREISERTGVLVRSYDELMDAQRSGLLVQDQATGQWLSAAQAQEKLGQAVEQTQAELARASAATIVAEFDAAAKAAGSAEQALDKLAEKLQFKDVAGAGAFVLALDELASKGKLSAAQVGDAWQQALSKLNAGQIGALRANLEEAARQGVIGAKQWAQANEQILAASFKTLGVNAAQALGQVSAGAQEAINSIDLVADSAKVAGVGVEAAARAIEMAFIAAIPKADSLEAIAALEQKLQAMGQAGQIGAQGLERVQAALDKQKAAIEGQLPGIQSLEEALRNLGVKPQAELKRLAASAKESFDAVKASGKATPREISEAWKVMAEAAIAANDGVADASIKAQASQNGFAIETDKAGKSIVKSMKEAEDATGKVGDAAKRAAGDMGGMADAAWAATDDLVEAARKHNAALGPVQGSWMDAQAAASKYARAVAELLQPANAAVVVGTDNVRKLREEHARLVGVLEGLDAQQKAMEGQGNGAARGVEDLRLRLLELEGTEAQVAQARHARDVADAQRKLALLRLDLQRAEVNQVEDEANRLRAEIALMSEQLKLLDQVFAAEQRQANARGDGASQGGGRASGGSGGGSGGGGMRTGPVNITLHANGINDPARLARMIEPELARLGRLAR